MSNENNEKIRQRILSLIDTEFESDAAFERAMGLRDKTVNNWRRGRSASYMKMLPTLSERFSVNVGELLDGYDAKDETETVAPATEPVVEAPVVEEPVVEEPVVVEAPVVEEPVHVDAATADELLTDEEAEAKIEVIHTDVKRTGKLVEINLDVICENFEDDEIVNLEALKAGIPNLLRHVSVEAHLWLMG